MVLWILLPITLAFISFVGTWSVSSGTYAPENSLFTATINAGSFLFLLFCILHHSHVIEKHGGLSVMSRMAAVLGVVASLGAFIAANCNPYHLALLHNLGAAVSFVCICFYTVLLTELTKKSQLSGLETYLYPYRIVATIIQAIVTICYTIMFAQEEYFYRHLSAIFEWMLGANLQLFELSYVAEFYYFSSYMISNLLGKREEQKPLMLTLS
uniref:CWH43-like N-terminal domain-containing protein n=1 Tax=Periophthalmus magnuspinnatus TaxID=409849 RepID=A0A3B4A7I5_9GOBI